MHTELVFIADLLEIQVSGFVIHASNQFDAVSDVPSCLHKAIQGGSVCDLIVIGFK
jgi:hypothetical protein